MTASNWGGLGVADVTLHRDGQTQSLASLPLSRSLTGDYSISLSLDSRGKESVALRLIPDDELHAVTLNGEPVSLQKFSRSQRRDYSKGLVLPLAGLNPEAPNTLRFELSNASNPAGFDLRPVASFSAAQMGLVVFAFLLLAAALYRPLPISKGQGLVLALGLIACLVYLSQTDSYTRTFDVYEGGGHRDYIHYVIEHKSFPPASEGWEYHQPPAYYTLAALVKVLWVEADGDDDRWGQWLALWLWAIFLWASLAALRLAFRAHPGALLLASVALCLWPSGIVHSIRIGNDVPLYTFYALGFYFCLRWWQTGASRALAWAAFWAACALLTKSNALALWAVLGCLWFLRSARHGRALFLLPRYRTQALRAMGILGGFFAVAVALNLGDNLWHYWQGESADWLLSNVSTTINPGLQVANKPFNYLVLDIATYLQYPFISSWDDQYGRQYFWNYLLRSSLSSEFFYQGQALALWGKVNGVLLLAMLVGQIYFAAIYHSTLAASQRWRRLYRAAPWLLAIVFPLLLLLAYRIKVPLSCNTDFRYVYMLLVPLLYVSARVWTRQCQWLAKALALAAPLIGLLSVFWLAVLLQQ
ncbi:hypothetical protein [Gilvimarinus xylanilyticus]|uniref:Glycosyltransferase RgtA/B/C/D-like domain-containing protein n=1 Tax=Gilvimarinus xylanilyticus TaxID=2944139 RepID=A0A9X2KUV0_9GAMM|nr:hypothetical protein [Gilvimarinus xylanilyticus]MCP8900582.1 hypothetical protein [Gilvimarinus xylanilyticus]